MNIPSVLLPVSDYYIEGLDLCILGTETKTTLPQLYFKGKIYDTYVPYFYVYLLFFKEPLIIVILFVFCFLFVIKMTKNIVVFILVPMFSMLLFFSFTNSQGAGIRHILQILPFIYIFCSGILKRIKKSRVVVMMSFILIMIVSNFKYYPNYLSYFNELMNPLEVYKYFDGSVSDWHHIDDEIAYFVKNSEYNNIRIFPTNLNFDGYVIIYSSDLSRNPACDILRNKYKPIKHFNYCAYIFKINEAGK